MHSNSRHAPREPETRDRLYEEISRLVVAIASDAARRDVNTEPVKKSIRILDELEFLHGISFLNLMPPHVRLSSMAVPVGHLLKPQWSPYEA